MTSTTLDAQFILTCLAKKYALLAVLNVHDDKRYLRCCELVHKCHAVVVRLAEQEKVKVQGSRI